MLSITIAALVVTGFIVYVVRQLAEFGKAFSVGTLLLSSKCGVFREGFRGSRG